MPLAHAANPVLLSSTSRQHHEPAPKPCSAPSPDLLSTTSAGLAMPGAWPRTGLASWRQAMQATLMNTSIGHADVVLLDHLPRMHSSSGWICLQYML